jgi:hypothetical protein
MGDVRVAVIKDGYAPRLSHQPGNVPRDRGNHHSPEPQPELPACQRFGPQRLARNSSGSDYAVICLLASDKELSEGGIQADRRCWPSRGSGDRKHSGDLQDEVRSITSLDVNDFSEEALAIVERKLLTGTLTAVGQRSREPRK